MKDDSGVWECFALPYKLGLNPDQKRCKDLMMKDDIGAWECFALPYKLGLNPEFVKRGLKTR